MTNEEFSTAFDTLLNSYNTLANFGETASKQDIVLDEYEKSVFLTQAQDIIVKQYFDSKTNPQGEGFDDSTRRQMDFSSLITVKSVEPYEGEDIQAYDSRGRLYKLPSNILVVLNEKLLVSGPSVLTPIQPVSDLTEGTLPNIPLTKKIKSISVVIPINYKEYDRQMSKSYTQPLKKQCWRLFLAESGIDTVSELIPIDGIIGERDTVEYKIRYIRRPRPIILQDFSQDTTDSVQIDGINTISTCELNKIIHMDILNKAYELALTTRGRMNPAPQNDNR